MRSTEPVKFEGSIASRNTPMRGEVPPLSKGAASTENDAPERVASSSTSSATFPPRWLPNGSRVPRSAAVASWVGSPSGPSAHPGGMGSPASAEEVIVDTFHQAWREAGRFDAQRGAPMAFLMMMCRSRALDALRGRDRALLHEDPASLIADADHPCGGDPLDLLAAVEAHSALHGALASLTPAQRQMVALAFFRGMTDEEIAAHAALPLGTVKSQIRRALDVLRRTLATGGGVVR